MGICLSSIYEIFSAIRHDFIKYRSVKVFIITYILTTAITISYGTYCMLLHFQQNSCWITFTIGVLLLMFAVTMILFSMIATCLENSVKQRITRNPIIINS